MGCVRLLRWRSWLPPCCFREGLDQSFSLEQPLVLPVALGLEFVVGNEAQGGRIDAIAQAAGLGRPIVEDMTEVTITMGRADLDAGDPVAGIELLDHIFTFKWNREA